MLKIKIGDIFRKDYIDHSRNFLAIEDSVGVYCHCIDIGTGERELVKIPLTSNASTSIVMLSCESQ